MVEWVDQVRMEMVELVEEAVVVVMEMQAIAISVLMPEPEEEAWEVVVAMVAMVVITQVLVVMLAVVVMPLVQTEIMVETVLLAVKFQPQLEDPGGPGTPGSGGNAGSGSTGASGTTGSSTSGICGTTEGCLDSEICVPESCSCETALPISLLAFGGSVIDKNVELIWSTASETNNAGFEVQRITLESESWETLGFIEGMGTTTVAHQYEYVDQQALTGESYYRLKQIDFDGNYHFSNVISIEMGLSSANPYEISPNPVGESLNIQLNYKNSKKIDLELYNASGQAIWKNSQVSSTASLSFDTKKIGLAPGIYYMHFINSGEIEIQKIVVH